jgi:N-acetylmuramoyl-L-alanine amidase
MLIGSHRANEYNIPSILIEVAYLSNTEDAKRIEDTKNQEHYINAIVK